MLPTGIVLVAGTATWLVLGECFGDGNLPQITALAALAAAVAAGLAPSRWWLWAVAVTLPLHLGVLIECAHHEDYLWHGWMAILVVLVLPPTGLTAWLVGRFVRKQEKA